MAKTTKPKAATAEPAHPYRLGFLQAENFKKLRAVTLDIDKNQSVFTVSGRNEQGKSSVLDAFVAAVSGKEGMPPDPVRTGQKEAVIKLDFGGLQLTRRIWNKAGGGIAHEVTLEYANGTRPKHPQNVLDELRGSPIADDPLQFSRLKPKDQFDLLKPLVPGYDFAKKAKERKELYEERTQVGRDFERAKGAVESFQVSVKATGELVDVTALAAELRDVSDHNSQIDARTARREAKREEMETLRDEADQLIAQAKAKNAAADAIEQMLKDAEKLPAKKDAAKIEQQINDAESINSEARQVILRQEKIAERDELSEQYDDLTKKIEAIDQAKTDAIAKAKLPIEGLSFGEDEILLDGLPFEQASTARRIRVATALLMAMKPDLRVLLVREGSLLDDDSMAALNEDAKQHGFVVLVERVGDGDSYGVVIEDGEIVS